MKSIYVDTSVFGGNFDEEFKYWTQKFFEEALDRNTILLKSDVVDDELSGAPLFVQKFIKKIPSKNIRTIILSKEAVLLAEKYLKEEVVGKTSRADCLHIAFATIEKADLFGKLEFQAHREY